MLCPRFSQVLIPSGKKDGDCLVHGLLLPTSTLGWREKQRACNPEGSDSELSRMAVAHLAQNWDGWVFLHSNNSLMLVLQVLSAPTCGRMKPGLPLHSRACHSVVSSECLQGELIPEEQGRARGEAAYGVHREAPEKHLQAFLPVTLRDTVQDSIVFV